ncbi:DUF1684 domain-containing protein [Streptomyces katsurahamanus]|uniref:DUF1684 domain-containing protein n=1 Tax=Streptomyces katsurahamanus TaxID=2577098 RepID=A0ABW9NNJ1_9ACTN|nr:DUF1684 domain-containing protein [Streptomyces katsurahamanus]MQS34847.1 DUF1684 domain-containing protein [Streptomyces katsurahamanus]
MSTDAHPTPEGAQSGRGRAPDAEWRSWHARRLETITAPYGPLSLTGTHWLDDHPDGRIPGVPGVWVQDGEEIVLTAAAADGLTHDGELLSGSVRLTAHHGPIPESPLAHGDRRLVVLRREGLWAVRDFDPHAAARSAFQGIEATPYDPRWALPGRFRPYPEQLSVRVRSADGRERGLGLSGEVVFAYDGAERTLRAVVEGDGSLGIVFADATSGDTSYRFRFLRPFAPAADGTVTVDLNRALLPPCAFAGHFICPFPPPGNTLGFAVPAGERRLIGG